MTGISEDSEPGKSWWHEFKYEWFFKSAEHQWKHNSGTLDNHGRGPWNIAKNDLFH